MKQEKVGFGKIFIIALIITVVAVAFVLGFSLVSLPVWPLFLLYLVFSMFQNNDFSKLPALIGGSFIGFTMGFGQNLLTLAFGAFTNTKTAASISSVGFLVILFIVIACQVGGKLPQFINPNTFLVMTLSLVPGLFDLKFLVPYYAEFAVLSIILLIIGAVKSKASQKVNTAES